MMCMDGVPEWLGTFSPIHLLFLFLFLTFLSFVIDQQGKKPTRVCSVCVDVSVK